MEAFLAGLAAQPEAEVAAPVLLPRLPRLGAQSLPSAVSGCSLSAPACSSTSFASEAAAPLVSGLSPAPARRAAAALQAALAGPGGSEAPVLPTLPARALGQGKAARGALAAASAAFLDVEVPGSQRRWKATSSGQAASAAAATVLGIPVACSSRKGASRSVDFLFGNDGASAPARGGILPKGFNFTPTLSMMPGGGAGAGAIGALEQGSSSFLRQPAIAAIDFTEGGKDDEGDPPTGWAKVIPRTLRIFAVTDLLTVAVLMFTSGSICDQPLRLWLIGGLLLGFPVTWLVNKIHKSQTPAYKLFRLICDGTKGDGESTAMSIDRVELWDRLGLLITEQKMASSILQDRWVAELEEPTLLTGYSIVTHRTNPASQDPSAWILEGSKDGIEWEIVHEVEEGNLPQQRGANGVREDYLMHLGEAHAVFRTAWFAEFVANCLSLAWLVRGTGWVGAGAEECVDGAPLLFYWCYLKTVLTWSMLGTGTMMLIISAFAVVITRAKAGDQRR
eukprot:TRINITY_DN26461_c0_g1_i1.p1 TRINITY_DN26461_c0_g1~~TRINITY_DN26461_c0_g1_i1.p1  ORF type:complete len:525 (+),score=102.29 TRINITY_DN26461_c0_g1_i1:59-1576(+)